MPSKEDMLFAFVRANDLNSIAALLSDGVSIEAKDRFGLTPLFWAVKSNQPKTVEFLLSIGANIHAMSHQQSTVLMYARSPEMIHLLLDAGANVHAIGINGNTALSAHATWGPDTKNNVQIINLLLQAGANKEFKNEHGDDVVTLAMNKGHTEIASVLKNAGNFRYRLHKIAFDESTLNEQDRKFFNCLCDPLLGEIMEDPISVSTGITYDRASLQAYFDSKKKPVTVEIRGIRRLLKSNDLGPGDIEALQTVLEDFEKERLVNSIPCPITRLPIQRHELHHQTNVFAKNTIDDFVTALETKHKHALVSNNSTKHISQNRFFLQSMPHNLSPQSLCSTAQMS